MANTLPKIFKRKRYFDYETVKEHVPAILNRLSNTFRGSIMSIHAETGIPYSTLSRWHRELMKNPSYNPLKKKYGQHKRIFTDEEEDAIADFIIENYINPGLHFTDDDFRVIAMEAWREKYLPILNSDDPNERKKFKNFSCSAGFISDFKYHHRFSSKSFHIKRRSDPTEEIQKKFMLDMKKLFDTVPIDRILNADETGWKLMPKGILTWGETGVDNISKQALINDKTQITVLATISAANTKLPLLFIAQGKTQLVENTQLGDVAHHWKFHTESGWMTDEAFQFYLHRLREYFEDDEPIHLIIDLYPAHMTDQIYKDAQDLNIHLHVIPAGMTDLYQPLDRKVFGSLKSKARHLFKQRHELGKPINVTKRDACQDVIRAWEGISYHNLEAAWEIYTEDSFDLPSIGPANKDSHHYQNVCARRNEMFRKRSERRRQNI